MHRPSSTMLQEVGLKEALLVGWNAVVENRNAQLLYAWDREYIWPLVDSLIERYQRLREEQLRDRLAVETFLAKLVYFHPYFLEKVAGIFQGYSLQGCSGQLLVARLQVLNVLVLVDLFPVDWIDHKQPQLVTSWQRVLWLNLLPSLNREGNRQEYAKMIESELQREELFAEVKQLRDWLYELRQQKSSVNDAGQEYIRIKDYTPPKESQTKQALRTHQFLVLVSPDQELPEDIGDHLQVWVDKTIDYNGLVGNYICTETFGEFKWMQGPLVYALEEGIVLVLNNFQQASNQLIVALKNIVNNGYLFVQNLGQKIHARLGFKLLALSNQPSAGIDYITEGRKNVLQLIPDEMPTNSRQFFVELFHKHHLLGYVRLKKLWKRIEYRRKMLLEQQQGCTVNTPELWKGHITEHFREMVHEELEEVLNIYRVDSRQLECIQTNRKLSLGRVMLQLEQQPLPNRGIVHTQYSLRVLEKLLMGITLDEPLLLISETGCGKTTLVQHLASLLNKKLYVFNMSLGSDVVDLVGGFKPVDCKILMKKLLLKYIKHFNRLSNQKSNEKYISSLHTLFERGQHKRLLDALVKSLEVIEQKLTEQTSPKWKKIRTSLERLQRNVDRLDSNLVFMFLEGNLLRAIKEGNWILIDEINLASNEMLQKIVPLIAGKSIVLYEKGEIKKVERHPNFRLFGCMNPGNDFGKKSLPVNLMEKFTVLTLPEPDRVDVELFINSKCPSLNAEDLTTLYFEMRKTKTLSLRNLSRALNYININREFYGPRAVYDGLLLGFNDKPALAKYECKQPNNTFREGYTFIEGFWVKRGIHPNEPMEGQFKLTAKFREHLMDLLRAIAGTDLPVLLEGPTSAGKTTMIRYIASQSNHKCIRINNHEHTDVEEYLGSYYPSKEGNLVFREGVLVEAVRNGYWLILDELNLARSEILECLNRLLDDNRELFLPESQKHLKPHPDFRIFATQNPSSYSGRKNLSKAFRNRFVQILMNEISPEDTVDILAKRVPLIEDSKELKEYMLRVINELARYRLREKVFIKDAIVTIRDLLKWTTRQIEAMGLKEALALEGYCILAERLRTEDEKQYIKTILLGKSKSDFDELAHYSEFAQRQLGDHARSLGIQMNSGFKRMAALTLKAHLNGEPTLLVGETGCGKTTLAEMIAERYGKKFYSINCHKHTEASDFIGCLRPTARNEEGSPPFQFVDGVLLKAMQEGAVLLIDEINTAEDSVLERMNEVFEGGGIGVERGSGWEQVEAQKGFYIIATMNPSGDFGKKELSPALRNRFTEIWVEPVTHPKYLSLYQQPNVHNDLKELVASWLSRKCIQPENIPDLLFEFVCQFNLNLSVKHTLQKKMLTMRDIIWLLSFIDQSRHLPAVTLERYGWGLWILTVEGAEFHSLPQNCKDLLKTDLKALIEGQTGVKNFDCLSTLRQLDFPLLLTTDLPLKLLGIDFQRRIFFNPQTQLSDLLGQFRPEGASFRWVDGELLTAVKEGGTLALVDLNLAQQQVVEGINSLFDYRGSIYVVDIGQTYRKAPSFRPVVVLKTKVEGDRKMLPNSFLNRFVKLHIRQFSHLQKIAYLRKHYHGIDDEVVGKLTTYLEMLNGTPFEPQLIQLELFCSVLLKSGCLKQALRVAFIRPFGYQPNSKHITEALSKAFAYDQVQSRTSLYEETFLRNLPLLRNSFGVASLPDLRLLLDLYTTCRTHPVSVCLKGQNLSNEKWNIVQCLASLLSLEIQHILLSNSTDTAELLGSFEQVNQQQQDNTTLPVFKYVDSRLVKLLNQPNTLVYVEVFADHMVERLEKGLSNVYDRKCRVIVGCDGLKLQTEMAEFQYCRETANPPIVQSTMNEAMLACKATPYFSRPNLTNFESLSQRLNVDNPQEWLTRLADRLELEIKNSKMRKGEILLKKKIQKDNQSERLELLYHSVKLVLQEVESQSEEDLQDQRFPERLVRQIHQNQLLSYQQSRKELLTKLAIDQKMFEESHPPTTIASLTESMPKSESEYRVAELTRCLVSVSRDDLQRHIRLFDQAEHQRILKLRLSFLRMFALNTNNFRNWTISILRSLTQSLVGDFQAEILRIESGLPPRGLTTIREDIDQVVVRSIPHLQDQRSVVEYLSASLEEDFPFNELFRCINSSILPSLSILMDHHEKLLADSIEWLINPTDYAALGSSLTTITIKNYYVYERLFLDEFKKLHGDLERKSVRKAGEWLINELKHVDNNINFGELTDGDIGRYLYEMFKPESNIHKNLSYFARQDIEYRALEDSLAKRQSHLNVYEEMCNNRYGGYQASRLLYLQQLITVDKGRLAELRKKLVYRGSDNIQDLKLFYLYLLSEHQMMVDDSFSRQSIRRFAGNLFQPYYSRFRDILFPLLTAVMLICPLEHQKELPVLLHPKYKQPSLRALIKDFTVEDEVSKFEEDNAKRHILLQKKLHDMIVDEYTEKGVLHHKQREEEDFKQTFGAEVSSASLLVQAEPIDRIYSFMRGSKLDGYKFSLRKLPQCRSLRELAVCSQLLQLKESTHINIYSQPNVKLAMGLSDCIAGLLSGLNSLMDFHNSDAARAICLLLNTILQQRILTTQLYKLLASCQHAVEKIYELNQTLPKSHHIDCRDLTTRIMEIRRIEKNNWEGMLTIKDTKLQKADVIELVHLCRMLNGPQAVGLTRQEVFEICDRYLKDSNLSTFLFRIQGLKELKVTLAEPSFLLELDRIVGYYSYFMDEFTLTSNKIRTEVTEKIKEDKKLAGWSSNEFLIFKSTCEKFQKSVHRSLKKYEDEMTHTGILSVIESKRSKMLADSIPHFAVLHPIEQVVEDGNQFEQLLPDIFEAINELKEPSHNNQSRLNVLRSFIKQLEQLIPHEDAPKHQQPFFAIFKKKEKAETYYYSIWDKLCQRTQAIWERDTIDRMWSIVGNAWASINTQLGKLAAQAAPTLQESVLKSYGWIERVLTDHAWTAQHPHIKVESNLHPMFVREVQALSNMVTELKASQPPQQHRAIEESQEVQRLYSLLKVSHVVATITINLQKDGFCTKEDQPGGEGQDADDGELQAGVGMAEGQAAEGAHNAGDQIEFEEQLQGLRGQQQAENEMDSKEDENDFKMEGDFQGEVRSQEQKSGEEEQDENKPEDLNEEMGSASGKEDFKMDQGQNSDEEDNNEDRRKEEELQFNTDRKANEQDNIQAKEQDKPKDKQRNLGEDDFEEQSDDQEGEENLEGGEKLDKDRMNQEEEEEMEVEDQEKSQKHGQQEEVSNVDEGEQDDEMELEEKEDQEDQGSDIEQLSSSHELQKDNSEMQPEEGPVEGEEDEPQEKQKPKVKPLKQKKAPAYGVEGQEQNPMLNEKEEMHGDDGEQEGEQEEGQQKQQKNSSSFSKKFLESLISSAKEADKERLKKDLNVVDELEEGGQIAPEQQDNQNDQGEDQDYGLADQAHLKTNLPSKDQRQREETREEQNSQSQENEQEKKKHEQRRPTESKPKKEQTSTKPLVNSKEKENKRLAADQQQQQQSLEEELGLLDAPKFQQSIIKEQLIDSDFDAEEPMKVEEAAEILQNNPMKPSMEVEVKLESKEELLQQADHYSLSLYEQLKAVLEPQQIASYQGDYKTGKKLNMKRIIGFIASNYRKDRIWLRRAEPTDRNYQIHLAMDDTKSMGINRVGSEALKGLMALGLALSRLNIKLSVSRIRDRMTVLTNFDELFTEESCRRITDEFQFSYEDVNSHNLAMAKFMSDSVQYLKEESIKNTSNELHQICFILSDGRFNKQYVRPYLTEAERSNQTYIFIVVDRKEEQQSILSIKSVVMGKDGRFTFKRYMDDFPFEYYLIVRDVAELSSILADVLRQYFEQK